MKLKHPLLSNRGSPPPPFETKLVPNALLEESTRSLRRSETNIRERSKRPTSSKAARRRLQAQGEDARERRRYTFDWIVGGSVLASPWVLSPSSDDRIDGDWDPSDGNSIHGTSNETGTKLIATLLIWMHGNARMQAKRDGTGGETVDLRSV